VKVGGFRHAEPFEPATIHDPFTTAMACPASGLSFAQPFLRAFTEPRPLDLRHAMTPKLLHAGEGATFKPVGQSRVIKVTPAESGSYLQFETSHSPGARVPAHFHKGEDEAFYILAGEYELLVGTTCRTVTQGAFAFVPRGTIHGFANTGHDQGRMLITVTPGTGHSLQRDRRAERASRKGPRDIAAPGVEPQAWLGVGRSRRA
jgi:quercetin dioxygenase-like cupin family protein